MMFVRAAFYGLWGWDVLLRCGPTPLLNPHPTPQIEPPVFRAAPIFRVVTLLFTLARFLNNAHRTSLRIPLLRLTRVQHTPTVLIYRDYDPTPLQSSLTAYAKPQINIV